MRSGNTIVVESYKTENVRSSSCVATIYKAINVKITVIHALTFVPADVV